MSLVDWFRERRSQIQNSFQRGALPHVSVSSNLTLGKLLLMAAFLGVASGFILWFVLSYLKFQDAKDKAYWGGNFVFLGFLLLPFLDIFFSAIRNKRLPLCSGWREFPPIQRWIACGALALVLLGVTDKYILPSLPDYRLNDKVQDSSLRKIPPGLPSNGKEQLISKSRRFTVKELWLYYWPSTTLGLFVLMHWLSRPRARRFQFSKAKGEYPNNTFSLWIGESTGWLSELWHTANIAGRQQVGLSMEDAAQNILILGAIGSGKTTRAVHPLLIQLLDQDCGGLIFDIKGDFQKAVWSFAEMTGRSPTLIGVGQRPMNLLAGLTPEMAASFLKSALLLGGGSKLDSFWSDTATELCRNALGILSFLPEYYHLNGLYRYLFEKSFQADVEAQLGSLSLDSSQERRLATYQNYMQNIFLQFDEKVRSGVLASVAQILSPFQHPELVDTFCGHPEDTEPMEAVLDGALYLVDMPLALWGVAGKVVYTLIKLRFFNVMQQRALHQDWDQSRPVFFMCDEYQEIVSCNKEGLSDLNFWDKSRSSKTIGIISAQSISSFYAAIGDNNLAHALLQNFRQKLIFRIEDDWTISYCNRLLGKVETRQIVQSSNTGSSSQYGSWAGSSSESSGESISIQQRDLIDGQIFRNMGADQVLALLSIRGYAADDVLNVQPVFV